ncbi:hypothetical protein IAT38_001188 [Cryptococcus sp. DSM 104549]
MLLLILLPFILFASFGHALSLATFEALLPTHLPSFITYTLPPTQPPSHLSSFIDIDTYTSTVYAIQSRWPDNFGLPPSSRLSTSEGVALVLRDPSTGRPSSWSQIDLTAAKVMVVYDGKLWDTTPLVVDHTASMPLETSREAIVYADHGAPSGLRWRKRVDDFLDAVSDLITGDRISVSLDYTLWFLTTMFGLVSVAIHCLRIHDSPNGNASLSSRFTHMKTLLSEYFRLATRLHPHGLLVPSTTTIPSSTMDGRGDSKKEDDLINNDNVDKQARPTKLPSDDTTDVTEASRSVKGDTAEPPLGVNVTGKGQKSAPPSEKQIPPSTSMPTASFTFTAGGPPNLQQDASKVAQENTQEDQGQVGPFTINADGKVVPAAPLPVTTSSSTVSGGSAPVKSASKGRKSMRPTPTTSSSHSSQIPTPPGSSFQAFSPAPMAPKKPDGNRSNANLAQGLSLSAFIPGGEGQHASSSTQGAEGFGFSSFYIPPQEYEPAQGSSSPSPPATGPTPTSRSAIPAAATSEPSSSSFNMAPTVRPFAPHPFAPQVAQASGSRSVPSGSRSRTRKAGTKKVKAEQLAEGASKVPVQGATKVQPEVKGDMALTDGAAVAGPSKSPAAGHLDVYDQNNINYHPFTTEFAGRTVQAIGDIGGKPVIAAEETMDGLLPHSTDFYTPPAPVDPTAPRRREVLVDPFAGMLGRGAVRDEENDGEHGDMGRTNGGKGKGPTKREKAQVSSFGADLYRASMIATGSAPDVILPSQKESHALKGKEECDEQEKVTEKASAEGKAGKGKAKEVAVPPAVATPVVPPVVDVPALELWVTERVNMLDDLIATWLPTHRHVYNHLKPGVTLPDEALELYQEIISRLEEVDYRWESEFGREGEIRFKYWLRRVGEE